MLIPLLPRLGSEFCGQALGDLKLADPIDLQVARLTGIRILKYFLIIWSSQDGQRAEHVVR